MKLSCISHSFTSYLSKQSVCWCNNEKILLNWCVCVKPWSHDWLIAFLSPRSFWSSPRIATSGQVQRQSSFEWLGKHNRLRPEPIRFVRLDSGHAQSDGKSMNCGLSGVGTGQRSQVLLLTKRSVASGDENGLITAGGHPGFCIMKWPGVFLLPLEGMLVHRRSLRCNLFGFPHNVLDQGSKECWGHRASHLLAVLVHKYCF